MKKKIIPIIFITLLLVIMFYGCDTAGTSGSTAYVGIWIGEYGPDYWIQYVFTESTFERIISTDSTQSEISGGYKGNITVYEDVIFMTYLSGWSDSNADDQIDDDEWSEQIYTAFCSYVIDGNEMTLYDGNDGAAFVLTRQ